MIPYRKHDQNMTMTSLVRAALHALACAAALPCLTSCGAAEPPPPDAQPTAKAADPRERCEPAPAEPPIYSEGQGDIRFELFLPASAPPEVKQAVMQLKEEAARPDRGARGCDPRPFLVPAGDCDFMVGACETSPFSAVSASSDVNLFFTSYHTLSPSAELLVEVVKCDATPSTVATRTVQVSQRTPEGNLRFSVPTEPEGKYFLRISPTGVDLQKGISFDVSAQYKMDPTGLFAKLGGP